MITMICLVWTSSIVVSLAPQFGWKDPEYMQRIEQLKCMVSQDVSYQVGTNNVIFVDDLSISFRLGCDIFIIYFGPRKLTLARDHILVVYQLFSS